MIYASVCSGVEAASLAWLPLGWKAAWFSEIEPFPCAVLKERFPEVPNLGDMNKIKVENLENGNQKFTSGDGTVVTVPGGVDLLVGGTPCQSFSVAGKREGLDGESGLARTFVALPRWVGGRNFYKGEMKVQEKRWKPEKGEMYWYVWHDGNVCWCDFTGASDERRFKLGNCFKTEAEAKAAAEKVKALLLSLHDNGNNLATDLPKLTAEVFNRKDCPEWAKYATVDKDGKARFHAEEPIVPTAVNGEWWCSAGDGSFIDGKFESSDWRNSLIGRPAKLPDWCKVGEWVFDTTTNEYVKVSKDDVTKYSARLCKYISDGEIRQSRLRPYNAEEMKALVGKVLTSDSRSNPFSFLVVYAEGDGSFVESHRFEYTAKELKDYFNIEGNPCGVLEHLDDEGEWVK